MGFMARRLYNMERQNNERIVQILTGTIHPSVKVELSEAACHEEVTKHSSILLTLPNGETINQYRCRMRWFMSAPGQPTLPMGDLSPTDANQAAWTIASVVNDIAIDMQGEADASGALSDQSKLVVNEPTAGGSQNFNECIQCGEEILEGKYCDMCS